MSTAEKTRNQTAPSSPRRRPSRTRCSPAARAEGERRLQRSKLELTTTSLVAGFDVVFGVVALAAATAAMAPHFGPEAGHFFGALAFGIAAAGNMIGGIIFVTLTRTSQAIGSGDSDAPTH